MRKLRSLLRLTPYQCALLLEASLMLAAAGIAIRVITFQRLSRRLGHHSATAPVEQSSENLRAAHQVGWAIAVTSRHLPWHPVCLPQAVAARWMLRRRGVGCTLYLGVSKTEGLTAHAWVRVGKFVVTGRSGWRRYAVVSTFA